MATNVYWVAFRLADNATRDERYRELTDDLKGAAAGKYWDEPTSFFVLPSELSINELAALVKSSIDEDTDIVVIGMPYIRAARVIGLVEDDDLFEIWDFVKAA
jgi:hypothetical protein